MTTQREPSRLPVRGTIGLGVTAAGLAFLFTLRAPDTIGTDLVFVAGPTDEGEAIANAPASAVASIAACASAMPVPSILSSPSAGAEATLAAFADPCATAIPSATTGTATPAEPAASGAPTATAAAAQTATLVGDVVPTRFGDVQVQVTVDGGTIVDVVALQLPDEDRRSLRISQEVESVLAEMAIASQSADIDTISGATYTSRAYERSLQSALDQLAA